MKRQIDNAENLKMIHHRAEQYYHYMAGVLLSHLATIGSLLLLMGVWLMAQPDMKTCYYL